MPVKGSRLLSDDKILSRAAVNPNYSPIRVQRMGVKRIICVTLLCKDHGEFTKRLHRILKGKVCPYCPASKSGRSRITDAQIMLRAEIIPEYRPVRCTHRKEGRITTIWVTRRCAKHGDFVQRMAHIENGLRCPACSRNAPVSDTEVMIRAGIDFEYPPVRVERIPDVNDRKVIHVVRCCKEHGEFTQRLTQIQAGHGCLHCCKTAPISEEGLLQRVSNNPQFPYVRHERRKCSRGQNQIIHITRLCKIHGEFEQTWATIKQGCICPSCALGGFDPTKPTLLYFLRIQTPFCVLYKIGITNRSIIKRYKLPADQSIIEVLYEQKFDRGVDAYAREQQLIKDNIEYQYKGNWRLKDGTGGRELFTKDILKSSTGNQSGD